MLIAIATMSLASTSCKDEDPFSTISPDDSPMILDPVFPDRVDGELAAISQISRDANFTMKVTVTPSIYTEVTWEIDGTEVHKGDSIDLALEAGTYHLKITATTTAGKSTYREANIIVSPLEDDPWSEAVGLERIVAPGSLARLYGTNLEKVNGVIIADQTITDITLGESEEGSYLEYEVPATIPDGEYRLSLIDASGNRYGANLTTVTDAPVLTSGFTRTGAGSEWIMTGLNLDKIATLNINGEALSEFVRQNNTELAVICPELPAGEYTLTGTDANGGEVLFYVNDEMLSETTFAITSETVLWEGHHYVSWDLADTDPNKTFNLIPTETFASMRAGSILRIHYSVEPTAEYHQIRTTTVAWNDLPGTAVIEFSEDGIAEVELTQEALDMIAAEGGFLCVGHGYYVDLVTVE